MGQLGAVRGQTDKTDLSTWLLNAGGFISLFSLCWGVVCVSLTSTCIQMLYFLQMSEMAMSGSKAPYTVVPAVALTKNGTKPCRKTNKRQRVNEVFFFFFQFDQITHVQLWMKPYKIKAPSVWPPVFSSPGRQGSVYHCRNTITVKLNDKGSLMLADF